MRRAVAGAVGLLLLLVVFVLGVAVGGHPQATGLTNLPDGLRSALLGSSGQALPDQVLDAIEADYYDEVDRRKLDRASVAGALAALGDPYTRYLTPEELRQARDQAEGAYSGVGIGLDRLRDGVVIARVFPGGPAARAGLRVGDRLIAVDGRRVSGPGFEAAVAGIKGPEGEKVRLTLARAGRAEPLEVTLERERIRIPAVSGRAIGTGADRVAYLRLSQFTRGAAKALGDRTRALLDEGARAVVLDLRGDPGGLVDEAVGVASVFLPKGATVVTTQGRTEPKRTLKARGGAVDAKVPLVVLVDRGSASSSEIVAGALRDQGRARLVGTRTFGKALVQTTRTLRDGGALKVTSARYVTPKGVDIAERGLAPSIVAVDDPATPTDEALRRAVAVATASDPR